MLRRYLPHRLIHPWRTLYCIFLSRSSKSQVGFQRSGSTSPSKLALASLVVRCRWSQCRCLSSSLNTSTVQPVHLVTMMCEGARLSERSYSWHSTHMCTSPWRSHCLDIEAKGFWCVCGLFVSVVQKPEYQPADLLFANELPPPHSHSTVRLLTGLEGKWILNLPMHSSISILIAIQSYHPTVCPGSKVNHS